MAEPAIFEQRRQLGIALEALNAAQTNDALIHGLAKAARAVAGADGATVIRREGDKVAYIAEDAVSPLWTGHSFAIEACISGQAILTRKAILIPDVFTDPRVPHAAYRPTFVKSMAMYPIGLLEPVMAVGAYWSEARMVDTGTDTMLATLARFAGVTLSRLSHANAA